MSSVVAGMSYPENMKASSLPITPPPMMITDSGRAVAVRAYVARPHERVVHVEALDLGHVVGRAGGHDDVIDGVGRAVGAHFARSDDLHGGPHDLDAEIACLCRCS